MASNFANDPANDRDAEDETELQSAVRRRDWREAASLLGRYDIVLGVDAEGRAALDAFLFQRGLVTAEDGRWLLIVTLSDAAEFAEATERAKATEPEEAA